MYIAVEGPIGVGKTTLARKLSESFSADLVMEKVRGKILDGFYSRQPGAPITTQFYFLYTRFQQQMQIKHEIKKKSIISDYTFAKNRIFAELNLSGSDLEIYMKYYELFTEEIVSPDVVIYLQGSIDSLKNRIARRGRNYEKKLKTSYLEKVISAYQTHLLSTPPDRLLIINTDDINVADSKMDYEDLLSFIRKVSFGVNYYHPPGSIDDPEGD